MTLPPRCSRWAAALHFVSVTLGLRASAQLGPSAGPCVWAQTVDDGEWLRGRHIQIKTVDGVLRCPQQRLRSIQTMTPPEALGGLLAQGCTF
jgi:hypothetical protein